MSHFESASMNLKCKLKQAQVPHDAKQVREENQQQRLMRASRQGWKLLLLLCGALDTKATSPTCNTCLLPCV